MDIKIEGRTIGKNQPCFIIAEAGVNHKLEEEDMKKIGKKSSLEVAFNMIDIAKDAGADAIKFQSFTAETLQYKGTKKPRYQISNVGTDEEISYFDMLKKLENSREDQIKIAEYCKKRDILFFATPYDPDSTDFLDETIDVSLFKLASIELNNHLFIRHVASKGKPIILSTGLSNMDDVEDIIKIAKEEGFLNKMIFLQCTSDYPVMPEDINLNVLKTYMNRFPDVLFGFSDHSPTDTASVGAVAIGAVVVEKHFTLDKTFKGPDHSSSLNGKELKNWVLKVREIEASMGSFEKKVTEVEKRNKSMRKFIVITPQKSGTIIKEDMLKTLRTGGGILPIDKNLKKIIGKKLKKDVEKPIPLTWDLIETS